MIIDSHVHIFPPDCREDRSKYFAGEPAFRLLYENPKARLAGVNDLVRDMDRAGVHRAVVFGFPWESQDTYRRHNDYVMEAVASHPHRLSGLGCFSLNSAHAPAEAERCLAGGLAGVGELAVYGEGFCMAAVPVLADVMQVLSFSDALLLLHANEPVGHSYPGKTPMDLADLYAFVKFHPRNRIILAHWGGGLFFFGLLKKEVRDVLKNVWFDTAASPFLYEPAVYKTASSIVGPDRILFGSDYPLIQLDRCLGELREAGLSREEVVMISGSTAERLFFHSG